MELGLQWNCLLILGYFAVWSTILIAVYLGLILNFLLHWTNVFFTHQCLEYSTYVYGSGSSILETNFVPAYCTILCLNLIRHLERFFYLSQVIDSPDLWIWSYLCLFMDPHTSYYKLWFQLHPICLDSHTFFFCRVLTCTRWLKRSAVWTLQFHRRWTYQIWTNLRFFYGYLLNLNKPSKYVLGGYSSASQERERPAECCNEDSSADEL